MKSKFLDLYNKIITEESDSNCSLVNENTKYKKVQNNTSKWYGDDVTNIINPILNRVSISDINEKLNTNAHLIQNDGSIWLLYGKNMELDEDELHSVESSALRNLAKTLKMFGFKLDDFKESFEEIDEYFDNISDFVFEVALDNDTQVQFTEEE